MRIIDLHCYPNTVPWIKSQGPYVEALAKYWNRAWTAKSESEVIEEFKRYGVNAVLVAFDIESVTGAPPCNNEYVSGMRDRHRDVIVQAWAAVDPLKGVAALEETKKAIAELGMLGFHFHPIMGHFSVDERKLYPLWETINSLKVPVMIDVGTTGMGAGMPGGLGAIIRHAHPAAIDQLAADFPDLNIVAAHPGWPWTEEMIAVALHKGNVSWELSGWAPKYFPDALKRDIKGRLKDKIMFGSDYPSIPYERIFKEWNELGYSDELLEQIFHANAERILGL
ncbi:MAG TPA: amidohydrolase family protein [Candidatus Binatia bacterium]|nr:amidohydrolase family protein [Candidatus Binatia bacterium]